MSNRPHKLGAALALVLASACSKHVDPTTVLGHWRAERVSVFSAKLPVGPDIVISEHRITTPDADVEVPINGIERKGDEATIDLRYGLGVTFYLDGPGRMYLKVPLIGKVYYRRVAEGEGVRTAVASTVDQPASGAVLEPAVHAVPASHEPSPQVQQAATPAGRSWVEQAPAAPAGYADYEMAVNAAGRGEGDAAIEHLNDALRAGFPNFGQLAAAPQFASLRADVRYKALIARYQ